MRKSLTAVCLLAILIIHTQAYAGSILWARRSGHTELIKDEAWIEEQAEAPTSDTVVDDITSTPVTITDEEEEDPGEMTTPATPTDISSSDDQSDPAKAITAEDMEQRTTEDEKETPPPNLLDTQDTGDDEDEQAPADASVVTDTTANEIRTDAGEAEHSDPVDVDAADDAVEDSDAETPVAPVAPADTADTDDETDNHTDAG